MLLVILQQFNETCATDTPGYLLHFVQKETSQIKAEDLKFVASKLLAV
jgi:hypothetical protein